MRILVVDDDYVSRTKLKKTVSKYGDVDTAPSGEIAFQMFDVAHKENVPYALLTVDVEMPGMHGQDLVKKIRDAETGKALQDNDRAKILMVTIKKDAHTVASSYYEGCEGYVAKPVTPESVEQALAAIGIKV